ncbi:hypothetical protein ABT246_24500 [Streptomyces sp. NPDC001553]|uniref:hypothetical protein n=1 Tax=Streptomyces sp. NPDC001553 TaxID=3154385 RepID=UPI00332DB625
MIRTVEVTWYFRPPTDRRPDAEIDRRQTVLLLDEHADQPNEAADNQGDIKAMLAITETGAKYAANSFFIEAVTPVCNCQPHPSHCRYAEFGGSRFVMASGSRIGCSTIRENVPDPAPAYPNRKLVAENVKAVWSALTLAAIVEREGHR